MQKDSIATTFTEATVVAESFGDADKSKGMIIGLKPQTGKVL
jgi:hypothetical protein